MIRTYFIFEQSHKIIEFKNLTYDFIYRRVACDFDNRGCGHAAAKERFGKLSNCQKSLSRVEYRHA